MSSNNHSIYDRLYLWQEVDNQTEMLKYAQGRTIVEVTEGYNECICLLDNGTAIKSHYDPGEPGYSEYTPGSPAYSEFSIGERRPWYYKKGDGYDIEFRNGLDELGYDPKGPIDDTWYVTETPANPGKNIFSCQRVEDSDLQLLLFEACKLFLLAQQDRSMYPLELGPVTDRVKELGLV